MKSKVIEAIPEKNDLSSFEPDEDGSINVRVDEHNEKITGENLVFLAKYAESKGFNDAIDEIQTKLNIPMKGEKLS